MFLGNKQRSLRYIGKNICSRMGFLNILVLLFTNKVLDKEINHAIENNRSRRPRDATVRMFNEQWCLTLAVTCVETWFGNYAS
jgi:hypothetical protein